MKITYLQRDLIPGCDESNLLWFEKLVDFESWYYWLGDNWMLSIWLAVFYIGSIFSLQRYMRDQEPFHLRTPLTAWNALLAAFSLVGTFRTYHPVILGLYYQGLQATTCVKPITCAQMSFWYTLFWISKGLELVDTFFIVLRKKPLLFLHWYHHATVLVYVWYTCTPYGQAPGRWFAFMNFVVHSLMYTYYACAAWGIRIPRWCAKSITFLQISQMVIGLLINVLNLRIKLLGGHCYHTYTNIAVSIGMYMSYFCLFAHFFRRTYSRKESPSSKNWNKSTLVEGLARHNSNRLLCSTWQGDIDAHFKTL